MQANQVLQKPKITIAFVHTFWDVFDHLGFWIGANLLCFLGCLTVVLAPVTLTGLLVAQKKIIDKQPLSIKDYIADCQRVATRSLSLGLLQIGLMGVGIFNVFFYIHWGPLGHFLVVASLFLVFLIITLFSFAFCLLAMDHSILRALKLGFFIVIKRPGFVAFYFVVSIIILFLCSVSMVAIPIVMMAIVMSFLGNTFDQIRRTEEGLAPRPLPERTFRQIFFPFD